MPKRKDTKGADYEYVGAARKTAGPDTEYASENAMNPRTKKTGQQARQGNAKSEYASEVAPSPGKRDGTRAKPKGRC